MADRFICVANLVATDGGEAVIHGNERVLSARLSDAKFFWEQDLKVPLERFAEKLSGIVFHEKLGTVGDKAVRMAALAHYLATAGLEDKAALAARLAKADLVSGMVGEFPEVQGIMGGYYARAQREDAEVSQAIAEHYSPAGPSDTCPTAPVSVAVALADKIDTLVGFFGIDERPTGSKDPYALRRAALGIIRLIIENRLSLALRPLFRSALSLQLVQATGDRNAVEELMQFFVDRLKVHLREKGVRHDLIAAVFAQGGDDDLVRVLAKTEALGRFLTETDGANLLVAYRRANNIVRAELKKTPDQIGRAHV